MSTSLERASAVAKFIELESVALTGATLSTNLSPLEPPNSLAIQSRYRANGELVDGTEQRVLVVIDFEFEGRVEEGDEDGLSPAVRLEATYSLVYRVKPDATYPEGAIEDFARLNGAYNAWPYWREMVQSVCGRAGLSGIIVPVFRASDFELRFSGRLDKTATEERDT